MLLKPSIVKHSLLFLFLILLVYSCGVNKNQQWLSTASGDIEPGFYLCRYTSNNSDNGFVDPASGKRFLLSEITRFTMENADTVYRAIEGGQAVGLTIQWTEAGRKGFAEFTGKCRGKTIAFVNQNGIVTAPFVQDIISGPQITLYGDFSASFMTTLISAIKAKRASAQTNH